MGMEIFIRSVLRARWWIVAATLIAVGFSIRMLSTVPLDALPDIADPQIIVYAKWQRSPQMIEDELTSPVIKSLIGLAGVRSIRGTSHMGYSFIYLVLDDEHERATVRQQVMDRINAMRPQLPADATLTLGPDAGSMGWIYQYALVDPTQQRDLRELRLINEGQVKPALQRVAGVAEVASVGGLEKQFQFKVFPPLLADTGLTLPQIVTVLQTAFEEVGGRTIDITNREYQLRGSVTLDDIGTLEDLVVGRDKAGAPVQLRDIGYLQVGYDLRRSIADLDGTGEVVGGIVIMSQGANVLAVIDELNAGLEELRGSLPDGVELVTTYDRGDLIWHILLNFVETLAYEVLVVIVIVLVFLRNFRTSLAPISILVLATLFTVLPLAAFGVPLNLLSLAGLAIAIGEMIDATIVIVENCSAELAVAGQLSTSERRAVIVRSVAMVTRPLLFSLLIILASFLPIFFLGAREARLFDPLAFAKTFAIAGSALLTVCLLPILIVWLLNSGKHGVTSAREGWLVRVYRRVLEKAIAWRYVVVGVSVVAVIPAIVLVGRFETDYMPELEEGSLLYMPTTLPGVPPREAGWILQQMDRKLRAFPEVISVFGKAGRADTATDSAPMTMVESTVLLRPKSEWREGMTKAKLVAEMNEALQVIGYVNSWSQPIATRALMQDTGIQTAVGIKVKGPELEAVEAVSREVEALLAGYPGTASVIAERIAEGYFVDANYDLARLAEHGVTLEEAAATVRYALGGDNVIRLRQPGDVSVPLSIQYAPEYTDSMEKLRTAPVIAAGGNTVPLSDLAQVGVRKLPEMIRNENGLLAGYVYLYLGDVTAPDYVAGAKAFLEENLELPAGYSLEWTGVYQYAQDASASLKYAVPATLLIIFALLLAAFRSWGDALLLMLSVPFAMVGGIVLQWWLDFPITAAVVIGYVALFAVAIQTAIIMVIFIRQALERHAGETSYVAAVIEGSAARLRPKLMTVAATALSLLPIMFSDAQGMEIMKPIALPTVGGMATSAIYVLFLIPCLYAIAEDFRRKHKQPPVVA